MKKTGKMSIIPIRDWMKNMPSKHAKAAAEIANNRLGQSRRANRYIIGMHRVPKMQAAMRQPKVLNPGAAESPVTPRKWARDPPEPPSPGATKSLASCGVGGEAGWLH